MAGTLVTEYEFSTDPRSPLVDGLGRFRDDKAYSLWDLTGSYRFTKNLRLRGGVLNVLDTAPPFTNQSRYFQVTWDPTYGDPRGRAYYLNLQYSFKQAASIRPSRPARRAHKAPCAAPAPGASCFVASGP